MIGPCLKYERAWIIHLKWAILDHLEERHTTLWARIIHLKWLDHVEDLQFQAHYTPH